MSIFSESDTYFFFYWFMVFDDFEARDLDDLSSDSFLVWDSKISNSLIFPTDIAFHRLEFFRLFYHFFRYESEFSSFVSKDVGLFFVFSDFFFETAVLSVLSLYTSFDLLDSIMVVPDKLLDFSGKNIEIQNPIGK